MQQYNQGQKTEENEVGISSKGLLLVLRVPLMGNLSSSQTNTSRGRETAKVCFNQFLLTRKRWRVREKAVERKRDCGTERWTESERECKRECVCTGGREREKEKERKTEREKDRKREWRVHSDMPSKYYYHDRRTLSFLLTRQWVSGDVWGMNFSQFGLTNSMSVGLRVWTFTLCPFCRFILYVGTSTCFNSYV